MSDTARMQRMLDEYEIFRVRRLWAYSRDHGDWETLRTCFHPDASVVVSWYEGSAEGFVEKTVQATAARKPEERSQHALGNYDVTVRGDRAVLEADMHVLSRDYLDGVLFDCICYGRFYDFFERRGGEWRIARWTCIYDKDRLDPVPPATVPAGFYDQLELTGSDSSFAFMRLRQNKKGRTVPAGLVMGGTEGERALKREGERWLAGA
jgi:hypothetical protein